MTSYGTLTSAGILNKTTFELIDGVSTLTEEITCDWGDKGTVTPSIGTAHASPYASYKLQRAVQEQLPGDLCKVTLVYQTPDTGEDGVPATTYTENSSVMEEPIQAHPDFDDWSADWDDEAGAFKPGTSKYGTTSYLVGTTTVTVTSYYTSKPAAPYGDIGSLETPGGGYGGTDKWLVVGANRGKSGAYWTVSKEYQYSAKGWDTDIYS